jgi:hypothetical protein
MSQNKYTFNKTLPNKACTGELCRNQHFDTPDPFWIYMIEPSNTEGMD